MVDSFIMHILLTFFFLFVVLPSSSQELFRCLENNENVIIPNGGTIKLFPSATWIDEERSKCVKIFQESPYQKTSPLLYNRYGWWQLERGENEYTFDDVLGPLLKSAIGQHARVIIGLASMCAESSGMSHEYKGKIIAVPDYLCDRLNDSDFPMLEDNQFCNGKIGYSVDYDSPIVYEHYSKLIKAFRTWLKGRIEGTKLRRSDVVYAIEMRHLGYWGEGAVWWKLRPKTSLINKYIELYLKEFPNKLLIGSIHSTHDLPNYKGDEMSNYSQEDIAMMRYNYKVLTSSNNAGRIGGFIDSWMPNSDQYDVISKRVLMDDEGRIIYLSDFLTKNYWGKVYLTGEFGYLIKANNKQYVPYQFVGEQFGIRAMSGISATNLTARFLSNGKYYPLKEDVYYNVLNALSLVGYRIVLNSIKIEKRCRWYEVTFGLKNIGTSGIFHNYYEMHILTKNDSETIINDVRIPFDFRRFKGIKYQESEEGENELRVSCKIPNKKGKIYLLIKDIFDIEYPMTLSNYGRMADGSYYIGKID